MTDLISRQQLAQMVPCSLAVIDEARRTGKLAFIQLVPGGKVLFTQAQIDAWFARCTHPARPINSAPMTYRKPRAGKGVR